MRRRGEEQEVERGESSGVNHEENLESCSSIIWGDRTLETMRTNSKRSATKKGLV